MEWLNNLLGLHTNRLDIVQMIARAVIVFFAAIVFVRVAGVRTLGKKTIFDQITVLILGTLMGNAIFTAMAPFSLLVSALIIMLLHRLVAWATFKSDFLGRLIKGEPVLLIKDGKIQKDKLNSSFISNHDLQESLRLDNQGKNIADIDESYLERSGDISFLKK